MTYSLNFRQKVLSIKKQEGLTGAETAVRFGIGVASITRWEKQIEPQRTRSKPATKLAMQALKQEVETYPDAYQYERAIGNTLKRLNIRYKKTVASDSGRKRMAYFSGQDRNLSGE